MLKFLFYIQYYIIIYEQTSAKSRKSTSLPFLLFHMK